jgi:hypothetical protein
MSQSIPLNTLGPIQAVAYAGTDLDVHIACTTSSGRPVRVTLEYPQFSRLLRERADRKQAIALLEAFRHVPAQDQNSGLRQWNLIQVNDVLGCELRLENLDNPSATALQSAA